MSWQVLLIWFGGTYNYVLPNIIYLVWWYLQLCLAKYYLSSLVVLTTVSCQVLFIWLGGTYNYVLPSIIYLVWCHISPLHGNYVIVRINCHWK